MTKADRPANLGFSVGAEPVCKRRRYPLENEKASIRLDERIRLVRRELTEKEKAERSFFSTRRRWAQERVSTGELCLKIAEPDRHGIAKEWRDEPDAPIETKLGGILAQLAGAFEELRLHLRREAEERERQWKIAEQRRLAEMEQKRETIRVRRLISYCDDWRTAAHIRALVVAVESSPLALAEAEKFASWKSWALHHSEIIDPLRDDDLLDRKVDDYEVYSLRD